MKYINIFKKISNCDLLTLAYQYPIERILKELPIYNEYCLAKVALRKQFEKEYKSKFKGQSFRVFISRYDSRYTHVMNESDGLTIEDLNDIKNRYDAFIKDNEDKLNYFVQYVRKSPLVTVFLKETELEKYLESISLIGIRQLFNAEVRLKVSFTLNKEAINAIIENLVDDLKWDFQDPVIFYRGKLVFSSTSHEDYYGWYKFDSPNA